MENKMIKLYINGDGDENVVTVPAELFDKVFPLCFYNGKAMTTEEKECFFDSGVAGWHCDAESCGVRWVR